MGVTVEALKAASPGLLPLVAHDRATFGGMMFVFQLSALWGFRRGAGGLWWTMLISGLSAYAAAIGVHYTVLYTSPEHLLPAWTPLGQAWGSSLSAWGSLTVISPDGHPPAACIQPSRWPERPPRPSPVSPLLPFRPNDIVKRSSNGTEAHSQGDTPCIQSPLLRRPHPHRTVSAVAPSWVGRRE